MIAVTLFLPLARFFDTPRTIPAGTGVVALVRALILVRLARLADWRHPVVAVAVGDRFSLMTIVPRRFALRCTLCN